MAKQEMVLAVRASAFKEITQKESGFMADVNIDLLFQPKDVIIASREWLENDTDWLQLLGYVTVRCDTKVLLYSRTSNGGESRLHDKLSIFYGGHTSIDDITTFNETINLSQTIATATSRELGEELGLIVLEPDIEFKGLVWDFTDEVGKVHLGLLGEITLDTDADLDVEDCVKLLGFKTIEEITYSYYPALEKWSQIGITQL